MRYALIMALLGLVVLSPASGGRRGGDPCTTAEDPYYWDMGPVAWSPDGKRIAFTRTYPASFVQSPGRSHFRVLTVSPDGSGFRALTGCLETLAWTPNSLRWSPASDALLLATRTGIASPKDELRIAVVKTDGSGITLLARGIRPDWSPDGKRVVYERNAALYTIAVTDGVEKRIAAGIFPDWSPDGSLIAFSRDGVRTVALDGSRERRLAAGLNPVWSPDGSLLALSELSVDPRDTGSFLARVSVVGRDGSGARVVARGVQGAGPEWVPQWHPSGKYLVAGALYPIDGSTSRRITVHSDILGTISFAPDGTRFAGTDHGDFCGPALVIQPLDGGMERRLLGRNCWISGTRRGDSIVGTNLHDAIGSGGGNDRVRARGGDDMVDSGAGNDRVDGGGGNDDLFGGDTGFDILLGGLGNDRLIGGGPERPGDLLRGGPGNDELNGGWDSVLLDGGTGDDVLNDFGVVRRAYGGAGNDRMRLHGGTVDGGPGDDDIFGSGTISGGPGDDRIRVYYNSRVDTVSCGPGHDVVLARRRDRVARDCEDVTRAG
jgi:Tol biopolymer transport system component